jgi:hypothetical protein
MLDEGPSKLYDALSLVLGLEDLVNGQAALAKSRLDRQKLLDDANRERERLVELLRAFLANEPDDRASACLIAITPKIWEIDAVEAVLASSPVSSADQDMSILTRAATLDAGDPEQVGLCIAALREAEQKVKAISEAMRKHRGRSPCCSGSAGISRRSRRQ